ncbi:hypothetical protein D9M69_438390 [compost metagenome]
MFQVVARQVAHLEFEAALIRDDVQRLASVDHADMHGAVGNVIGTVLGTLQHQPLLALAQRGDEVAGQMDGIGRAWRQRGMGLLATAVGAVGTLALVAKHELHIGRLTNDAQEGSHWGQVQHVEQTAHANATDLLIMGQGQLQRPAEGVVCRLEHRIDCQGDKTLHVAAATAVDPAVAHGCLERRDRPGLARRGHHVGVPGQQHARHLTRAGAGEQVGLASALVLDDQRLDALAEQQVAHILDERQVGIGRHRLKGDQPLENLQHPRLHDALLRCSGASAKRPMLNGAIEVLVLPVLINSAITSPTPGPSWNP